jgi:hypothetical protein
MEWLSSIHQIISYYKEQFVTSVYFTHGQQVTLPLPSLMRPSLPFRFAGAHQTASRAASAIRQAGPCFQLTVQMCIFVNMTAVNLDAYQVLNEPGQPMPMTQTSFDALVLRFRKQFLAATNYSASLAAHRRPAEYREEQRREVADYLQVIQRRPEMQDIDVAKKSSGHVPTAVKTIWIANKELRSCFAALEIYCTQRDVPVHRIGVHLAEYKAYDRLFRLLGRAPQVNPASLVMLSAKNRAWSAITL